MMSENEKKMDAQMDQILKERDHYFEQAEALKNRLQELLGADFGEHSSANCPFQNAIEYDDSHLLVINKSAVSVLYQDAEEPESFTHDLKEVPSLVLEHELGCEGIVRIDCISTANISTKHLHCIYEMNTDGSMEGELKMCESLEEAEKILAANMGQINAHIADQCEGYLEYEEEQKNASNYFLNFPNIRRAAVLLWTDNGMINREEPLSEKEILLWRWMAGLDQEYLARVNTALNFTDEDLDTICNGEETEAKELLVNEEAERFLNQIFDEEYEPDKIHSDH